MKKKGEDQNKEEDYMKTYIKMQTDINDQVKQTQSCNFNNKLKFSAKNIQQNFLKSSSKSLIKTIKSNDKKMSLTAK